MLALSGNQLRAIGEPATRHILVNKISVLISLRNFYQPVLTGFLRPVDWPSI
jgi:hypothetical protein